MSRLLLILLTVYPDGTLIFYHGGLGVRPIERFTGSKITHVAIVLDDYVYEATPPVAHKVKLNDYIIYLEQLKKKPFWKKRSFYYFVLVPNKELDYGYAKVYADNQLGRPYRITSFLHDKESRGIMCSQYVGNIIERTGLIKSSNNKESPVSLYNKIRRSYR